MNKTLILFLIFAYSIALSAQNSTIQKASIDFVFVDKDVKGSISGFKSTSKIDWNNLDNSFFEGSVAVETLDTNSGLRNWSLKSGKYFDKSDYPRIYFKSSKITQKDQQYLVEGTLTIKDIKKPITITLKQDGNQLIGTTSLYSYDYDIKIKKKREENLVKVTFRFELK
ncbi:YceI family protein [Croceitalea sp. P059]|uniref:YceI family protein n=1 Tax=Croceitalea sp. P059 TaxID=3075601 RepID=UPI002883FE68|nr:YceI family protein [Croceitalea sp. P059]MDT0539770.1 YceI family protein [Croceitalea sp. P059]